MTISVTDAASGPYYPNGVTVDFPFDFSVGSVGELRVLLLGTDGVEEEIDPAGYSATIAVDGEGGTVHMAAAPVYDGRPLWVSLDPTFEQEILFEDEGPFNSAVLNPLADQSARRALWLRDRVRRAVLLPFGEVGPVIGPVASRLGGKVLGFNGVTGAMEVQGAGAFKGDPGGNIMAIGLFSIASTLSIPAGADLVQTSGWSVRGRGAGRYVYDVAVDGAYVAANPRTSFLSFNGRGFRLQDEIVGPTQTGAVGDGVADDSDALQAALSLGRHTRLEAGKTYLLKRRLNLTASEVSISGAATIKIAADFDVAADTDGTGPVMRAIYVTGHHCLVSDVTFDCTLSPIGGGRNSACLWFNAVAPRVHACRFLEHPKGAAIVGNGLCVWMTVTGCQFENCTGAVFIQGRSPSIVGNVMINCTDAAIALNSQNCVGAVVSGNTISNEALYEIPSMIAAEEGASAWAITGNTLLGVNGGGVIATNNLDEGGGRGGVISGNLISAESFSGTRPVGVNPAALISISPFYSNIHIVGNEVRGCPSGNVNSRMVIVPATGCVLANNLIDGTQAAGPDALVAISAGTGGLSIRHNEVRGVPPGNLAVEASYTGRCFLFTQGSYGNVPVNFVGGKFVNAHYGIDAQTLWAAGPGITNLVLGIQNVEYSLVWAFANATSAIGDRATFLNNGAVNRPHRIGVFTEMYCDALPAAAGALAYQNGDRFFYLTPAIAASWGVVRVPGQWRDLGTVA